MAAVVDNIILCEEYNQRRGKMLQSGQWADCKFLVGAEAAAECIEAHKIMLAMASPVFETMLYGTMAEQNEIRIPDIQPETFRTLLSYMYAEEIKINSFDDACELFYGAKKYMMHHLIDKCLKYLLSVLCPKNACKGYEFAKLFELQILMDKCLQIICTKTTEVLQDISFEDVETDTIVTVFEQNFLNINSEMELFNAAVRYVKNAHRYSSANRQTQTEPSTPTAPAIQSAASSALKEGEVKPSITDVAQINVKEISLTSKGDCLNKTAQTKHGSDTSQTYGPQTVLKALKKIRFLTLSPQQFAKCVEAFPLLRDVEVNAIFMNISLPLCGVPMPDGFSISRENRKMLYTK